MDVMDEYDMEDMDGMGDMDGYGHEMGDGDMDMMGEYDDEAGHVRYTFQTDLINSLGRRR